METTDESRRYKSLYRVAFWASIAMLVVIPAQILVFAIVPLPSSVESWFALFDSNLLAGLFHADLFILVDNVLIAVIYLAFYHLLKDRDRGLMQIALVLGLVGIAAYISSNRTFELLALARGYGAAATEAERSMHLAAGKAMLAGWQGTAFDAYYVLNGITLLIISLLMFKAPRFTKAMAATGLAAAIFMIVPSTAGKLGLAFSLVSLVPWYVFAIRFARVFREEGAR